MTAAIRRIVTGRGRTLAVGLMVLAAISTMVVPSTAANAATFTTIAHVCKDIGHDSNGVHGIFCSDLISEPISGGARFYAQTEGFCQNASGYVECLDNDVYLDIYYVGGPINIYYERCVINTTHPCNANGRNYFLSGDHIDVAHGQCVEMWGVTWGDATDGLQSSIDLPGGRVKLVGNFETGHYTVCV